MKWANLSRATWFSPFLRMLPSEARLLYVDLSATCGPDGVMPTDDTGMVSAFGVSPDELQKLLNRLIGIGLLWRGNDGRIVVLDTAREHTLRQSKVAGGKAVQERRKATHAQHDAQHQCSAFGSSSLSLSSSPSGSDASSLSEPLPRARAREAAPKPAKAPRPKPERIDPATCELPAGLDTPEIRAALAGWVELRAERHPREQPLGKAGLDRVLKRLGPRGHAFALAGFRAGADHGWITIKAEWVDREIAGSSNGVHTPTTPTSRNYAALG